MNFIDSVFIHGALFGLGVGFTGGFFYRAVLANRPPDAKWSDLFSSAGNAEWDKKSPDPLPLVSGQRYVITAGCGAEVATFAGMHGEETYVFTPLESAPGYPQRNELMLRKRGEILGRWDWSNRFHQHMLPVLPTEEELAEERRKRREAESAKLRADIIGGKL